MIVILCDSVSHKIAVNICFIQSPGFLIRNTIAFVFLFIVLERFLRI